MILMMLIGLWCLSVAMAGAVIAVTTPDTPDWQKAATHEMSILRG